MHVFEFVDAEMIGAHEAPRAMENIEQSNEWEVSSFLTVSEVQ